MKLQKGIFKSEQHFNRKTKKGRQARFYKPTFPFEKVQLKANFA
jgi:hypothetical protein